MPQAAQREARIAQAVLEVVGSVAAPAVSDTIIRRAMRSAGLRSMPEVTSVARSFFAAELFEVASEILGEDAAVSILEQLLSVVSTLETSARLPSALLPSTRPPPARVAHKGGIENVLETGSRRVRRQPDGLRVFLATSDLDRLASLSNALSETSVVLHVLDSVEVLRAMGSSKLRPHILVIDCASPAIQVTAALRELRDLHETRVILWGDPQSLSPEETRSVPQRWLLTGPGVDVQDLAAICRVLS